MLNEVYLIDNMKFMKDIPDNYYELAICDPPYGIERFKKGSLRFDKKNQYNNGIEWDRKPSDKFFKELFRISKNQLIWGANNFVLPPTEYFCIWNKKQTVDNFATAEYCYVSIGLKKPAKIFTYSIHQHNADKGKIHPTQKPIALYKWSLQNYAKEGDKIIDTHVGSGSIRCAAYELGFYFEGCENNKDHHRDQELRFYEFKKKFHNEFYIPESENQLFKDLV
ncbi:site-specific DNA-methyltransferase [Candidatus Pacearchaeota archaeon]|nr:site-specific DNA-methyltransferase [Candidatus Pacearchaeota archaeon]